MLCLVSVNPGPCATQQSADSSGPEYADSEAPDLNVDAAKEAAEVAGLEVVDACHDPVTEVCAVACRAGGQIPPLATELVDERAVALLRSWIDNM